MRWKDEETFSGGREGEAAEPSRKNSVDPRDRAYLALLHHGLVLMRNFASPGPTELSRIEAEHLHELPTLVGDTNEARHRYYLEATRDLYLAELRKENATEYLEQVEILFLGPWQTLMAYAAEPKKDRSA